MRFLSASIRWERARRIPETRNSMSGKQVVIIFGAKLYSVFYKTYTEKVWGIPRTEIGADWAAQRIEGLSLDEAVKNALFGRRPGRTVKTLIDKFVYPRLGREWLSSVDGLYCIGRNGQHRYNNMDHSMTTALVAVRSVGGQ